MMRVGHVSGKTMQVSHKLLYPPPPLPMLQATSVNMVTETEVIHRC